jgi:hypothetical protein
VVAWKFIEDQRDPNPLSAIDLALLSKAIVFEVTQTKSIYLSHFSLTGEQLIELLSAQEGSHIITKDTGRSHPFHILPLINSHKHSQIISLF